MLYIEYNLYMKILIIGLVFLNSSFLLPLNVVTYKAEEIKPTYKEVLVEVTAYTSSIEETDSTPFLTASQTKVRNGIIACPRDLEFGTKIEIEGKIYICEDRMALKNNGKFDIWVESKDLAFEWGRRTIKAKIFD